MTIQGVFDGAALTLKGPGGSVGLAVASARDREEGNRDRVALELTLEVDVEGTLRPRIVLWASTHDSYDGEHRDVLEEGIVCTALLERINGAIGGSLDVEGLLGAVAAALPEFADAVACLRANLDSADVTSQLFGPNLD